MSIPIRTRAAVLAAAVPAVLVGGFAGQAVLADSAHAATTSSSTITVTKAELKGTQLRLEGHTPGFRPSVFIESTTSGVTARPDASGVFKAQSDTFTAPDCFVTVRDSSEPVLTVRLTGCTPSATAVPTKPAPASGSCVITAQPTPTTLTADTTSVFTFHAAGCNPNGPLSYSVAAGVIPTGMSVGTFQNSSSGNIIGTPSIRGTYRFTIQVTDAGGATDQENFTITVS